jgi:hypothetical protein
MTGQMIGLWMMFTAAGVLTLVLLPHIVGFIMELVRTFATSLGDMVSGNWQQVKNKEIERQVRQNIQQQARQQGGFRLSPFRREIPNHDVHASLAVLKETMKNCCELHHFTGEVLGVTHLDELRNHLICSAHRTRVLETTDYVLSVIAAKDVLADPILEKMAVGLDATRDTCTDCMLLQFDRLKAPTFCSPAKFLGCENKAQNPRSK